MNRFSEKVIEGQLAFSERCKQLVNLGMMFLSLRFSAAG